MTSRTVVEENTTTESRKVYDALTDPSRICARCVHAPICTVHRGIQRQIAYDFPDMKPEALPFLTPDIAKICRYYRRDNVGEEE